MLGTGWNGIGHFRPDGQSKKGGPSGIHLLWKPAVPWFWSKNSDWIPDMDNGGAGMITLQLMLMQCDGNRIQLLPAWPDDWTADFKLHAPYQTTVEGHVEHGNVTKLKVVPGNRAKDVVVIRPSDP